MAESFFKQVFVPQQKTLKNGDVFPAVLSPNPENHIRQTDISTLTEAIKAHKPWLESLLLKAGAILFRGFPLASPSDFNEVLEAFNYEELRDNGGGAPRTHVVGRVYTANEAPPEKNIPFHHELAFVEHYPSKVFFYCDVPPGEGCGGETPIVLSHLIYDKMKEKYPEFVEHLEEHGIIYGREMPEFNDLSSPSGRGWRSTFDTDDKSVAEEKATALRLKLAWREGGVTVTLGPMPAIITDEKRQRKVWFNNMIVYYAGMEDPRNVDPNRASTFGDLKPFQADIACDCVKIIDEECATIPWQQGDVLMIDNVAVQHARRPLTAPPRRILASFCK